MSATFVLLPGAGSDSWYWHLVAPRLRAHGHGVIAVDLPCDDDSAGLTEYAETVVDTVTASAAEGADLVLVAQSMGAFTAPLVCDRLPVKLLVLVAAMTPKPGESPGQWWENTGQPRAQREQAVREGRDPDAEPDLLELFFHDVAPDVVAHALRRGEKRQSATPFEQPWPLRQWPAVPTRFLLCRRDRLFPADFQREVVRERIGIEPDELDSGHLPALSRPNELTERLLAYHAELLRH